MPRKGLCVSNLSFLSDVYVIFQELTMGIPSPAIYQNNYISCNLLPVILTVSCLLLAYTVQHCLEIKVGKKTWLLVPVPLCLWYIMLLIPFSHYKIQDQFNPKRELWMRLLGVFLTLANKPVKCINPLNACLWCNFLQNILPEIK